MATPRRDGAPPAGRGSGEAVQLNNDTATIPQTAPDAQRPFLVVVDGDRVREWGRYSCEAAARAACAGLRRVGFAARVLVRRDVGTV